MEYRHGQSTRDQYARDGNRTQLFADGKSGLCFEKRISSGRSSFTSCPRQRRGDADLVRARGVMAPGLVAARRSGWPITKQKQVAVPHPIPRCDGSDGSRTVCYASFLDEARLMGAKRTGHHVARGKIPMGQRSGSSRNFGRYLRPEPQSLVRTQRGGSPIPSGSPLQKSKNEP